MKIIHDSDIKRLGYEPKEIMEEIDYRLILTDEQRKILRIKCKKFNLNYFEMLKKFRQ